MGSANVASNDTNGVMAALYGLLSSATDYYGNATAGLLTWTRDTTAGSQALYSSAFGPIDARIIFACHDTGTPSPSPKMIDPDTYGEDTILVGCVKSAAGSYASWNASAPFTSSVFAGYYRAATSAAAQSTTMYVWQSSKDVWIVFRGDGTENNTYRYRPVHVGAVLQGSGDLFESDGYRYGCITEGTSSAIINNHRGAADTGPGYFGKSNEPWSGYPRAGAYTTATVANNTVAPNALRENTIWEEIQTMNGSGWYTLNSSTFCRWTASRIAPVPVVMCRSNTPSYIVGLWAGVFDGPDNRIGGVITNGGETTHWVVASAYISSDDDSLYAAKTF